MPNGASGLEEHFDPWGNLNNLSALASRTQENITAHFQQQVGQNSAFDGIAEFFQTVFEGVLGLIQGLTSAAGLVLKTILGIPGEILESLSGKEDGNPNDLGTIFIGIRAGVQNTINSIVGALFGWVGELFSSDDADQALRDAASTIAGLSASVTALQQNQNNQAVGGVSVTVDFTDMGSGSTFGADFDHARSGGAGHYSIVNGSGAVWDSVSDSNATDDFLYNALETTTDYQKIWIAFGSSPVVFLGNAGRNEIHGRKNSTADTYVYAAMEKYKAELGCVVSGAKTIFATKTSGFSFKANSLYALECGTVGGLRIFRLLEGNTAVLTHTEVGTTSQAGVGYRYTGGLGFATASGVGSTPPGTMWAFALADNQPATVTGSGARMYRASTGMVSVSSGSHTLPGSFFDTLAENTADIACNLTDGSFTASVDSWYDIQFRMKLDDFTDTSSSVSGVPPFPMHLLLYKNGVVDRYIGDTIRPYGYDTHAASSSGVYDVVSPEGVSGTCRIFLQDGDYVQVGYDATGSKSSFLTGDSGGLETYFEIIRAGTKGPNE